MCSTFVALEMGAAMFGWASSQASATVAWLELCSFATASRASRTRWPRSLRYLLIPPPRGLLLSSSEPIYVEGGDAEASERYGITAKLYSAATGARSDSYAARSIR